MRCVSSAQSTVSHLTTCVNSLTWTATRRPTTYWCHWSHYLLPLTTYYRVQVRWDEDDARELSLEWLRGKCGYVPQEPLLFDIG